MRAAVIYRAGEVRVEHRPGRKTQEPKDAVVRVPRQALKAMVRP